MANWTNLHLVVTGPTALVNDFHRAATPHLQRTHAVSTT